MDTNKPETFGAPAIVGADATVMRLMEQAPEAQPERTRPAVQRLLQGDGANIIAFTFAPGQELPEHKAAHPITVQCLAGQLDFEVAGATTRLEPGVVVHLRDHIPHSVLCPADAPGRSILLLTMLTGERHSS
ncbi:cupin domain-containing protein [Corynebacterium sp. H130]|uniref:cupin domain-containing protein n=1 Tax=Corynebacterium sp. H130 TaxID=3133444 RepID=UPI00309BA837